MDAIGPEVDVMLGGEIALAPARNNARAPLRSTAVSGSVKVPGWESWKTLASVTAYHSFGGEVELRTPHDTPPYLLMPSPTSAHSSAGGPPCFYQVGVDAIVATLTNVANHAIDPDLVDVTSA